MASAIIITILSLAVLVFVTLDRAVGQTEYRLLRPIGLGLSHRMLDSAQETIPAAWVATSIARRTLSISRGNSDTTGMREGKATKELHRDDDSEHWGTVDMVYSNKYHRPGLHAGAYASMDDFPADSDGETSWPIAADPVKAEETFSEFDTRAHTSLSVPSILQSDDGMDEDFSDASTAGIYMGRPKRGSWTTRQQATGVVWGDPVKLARTHSSGFMRLPQQLSSDQHIRFLEMQRNPSESRALYIPSPREFERGGRPAELDKIEPGIPRRVTSDLEEYSNNALARTGTNVRQHITIDEPEIRRTQRQTQHVAGPVLQGEDQEADDALLASSDAGTQRAILEEHVPELSGSVPPDRRKYPLDEAPTTPWFNTQTVLGDRVLRKDPFFAKRPPSTPEAAGKRRKEHSPSNEVQKAVNNMDQKINFWSKTRAAMQGGGFTDNIIKGHLERSSTNITERESVGHQTSASPPQGNDRSTEGNWLRRRSRRSRRD